MRYFEELGIEFKSGLFFSIIAFVLSIVAGLIGSVPSGMIVIRSLVVIPLFFLVGFGALNIIKKFVPEVYEAISNFGSTEEYDSAGDGDISSDNSEAAGENSENREEKFTEFTAKDYSKLNSVNSSNSSNGNELNTSGGNLGKHIIVDKASNGYGYEPKVMAEAIRTMMSKE